MSSLDVAFSAIQQAQLSRAETQFLRRKAVEQFFQKSSNHEVSTSAPLPFNAAIMVILEKLNGGLGSKSNSVAQALRLARLRKLDLTTKTLRDVRNLDAAASFERHPASIDGVINRLEEELKGTKHFRMCSAVDSDESFGDDEEGLDSLDEMAVLEKSEFEKSEKDGRKDEIEKDDKSMKTHVQQHAVQIACPMIVGVCNPPAEIEKQEKELEIEKMSATGDGGLPLLQVGLAEDDFLEDEVEAVNGHALAECKVTASNGHEQHAKPCSSFAAHGQEQLAELLGESRREPVVLELAPKLPNFPMAVATKKVMQEVTCSEISYAVEQQSGMGWFVIQGEAEHSQSQFTPLKLLVPKPNRADQRLVKALEQLVDNNEAVQGFVLEIYRWKQVPTGSFLTQEANLSEVLATGRGFMPAEQWLQSITPIAWSSPVEVNVGNDWQKADE